MEEPGLTVVLEAADRILLSMATGLLEAADVDFIVKDEFSGQPGMVFGLAFPAYRILVAVESAQRAREALAPLEAAP